MERLSIPAAIGLLIVALVFMIETTPAEAFNKDAIDRDSFSQVENGVGVFMLTVPLGAWPEDMYIPVVGERGLPFASRVNRFGFELEAGFPQAASDAGDATGLIVANAEIVDGYYRFPAKTLASFKIIVVANVDEVDGNIYRMRITELPFLMGDEKAPGHFSDGEMKYLVTNYEPLHYEQDTE